MPGGAIRGSHAFKDSYEFIIALSASFDVFVATGETRSVREMCDYVFSLLDLDYKDFVVQNSKYLRPQELKYLKGDSTKIRKTLNWKPEYTFISLTEKMTQSWMDILK